MLCPHRHLQAAFLRLLLPLQSSSHPVLQNLSQPALPPFPRPLCRFSPAQSANSSWAGRTVLLVVPESRAGNGNLGHELKMQHSIFLTRRALGMVDDSARNATIVLVGALSSYTDRWGIMSVFADTVVTALAALPRGECAARVVVALPAGESPFWERHWIRDACPPSQLVRGRFAGRWRRSKPTRLQASALLPLPLPCRSMRMRCSCLLALFATTRLHPSR